MTKHIGMAAVSPEGAALCYRQIFRHAAHLLEPHEHPTVTIHNIPLAGYVDAVQSGDWRSVGAKLRETADVLASAGAEFCMTPDNAVQHAIHLAEVGSPLPWLSMTDLVAQAVERDERSTVGLIGAKVVTTGSTYQTHLGLKGITVLAPEADEVELLDKIIFGELVFGTPRAESRAAAIEIISRMKARGCQGVILGLSEARLLVDPSESALPIYDSSDILAEATVRHAMVD